MILSPVLCYLLCMMILLQSTPSNSNNSNTLLIIISFDGFRNDYINRNISDTLINLRNKSSHAPYMSSIFPSKTFPNHFSIGTGLYSEVHGVLDNKVYDQSSNKTLGYEYNLFHYNDDIVPLWILNEKGGGGRRSGCMMWPGSDFKYQDTLPSHYVSFNASMKWSDRVDTLLSWFRDPDTPINLGMLYFEQPDVICHEYGPDSEQVNREIARVDGIVQYLLKTAEDARLLSRLNFVFLSDHGGQAVKVPENIINLDEFVNKTWYRQYGVPPNLQIYPVKGKEAEVLEALRVARRKKGGNFSTYTREEILDRWRYKHCDRTPPILVTADVGFLFTSHSKIQASNSSVIGTHGYDPEEPTMRAFFMAMGPLFKKNYVVQPFENINIFPLAAHVLGLSLPALRPNGSLMFLQEILATATTSASTDTTENLVAGFVIAAACAIALLIWFFVRRNLRVKDKLRKSSSASYKVLNQGTDDDRVFEVRETLSSDCDEDSPT